MSGAWEQLDDPVWINTDKDTEYTEDVDAVEAYCVYHFRQLT